MQQVELVYLAATGLFCLIMSFRWSHASFANALFKSVLFILAILSIVMILMKLHVIVTVTQPQ